MSDFFVCDRLKGNVVVVTGAASGIGQACAERYAREGAKVVLADVAATGEAVAAAIRSTGADAAFCRTDVSDEQQVRALLSFALETFGSVDVWHNNAYWSVFQSIVDQTVEDFDQTVAVCLRGYWIGAKVAVTHMLAHGGGLILNTGSVQSYLGERGFSAYQVVKAGILGLTRSVAVDHAPTIRSVMIAPGLIRTPANDRLTPEQLQQVLASIPAARAAEPREIAGLCAYLASAEAAYITATTVVIDGGYLHSH